MRRIKFFYWIIFPGFFTIFSCSKSNFSYPTGTVGISKIVYFPIISINGPRYTAVVQGSAFNDPGAAAILNGDTTAYTVTGNPGPVSTGTPGVYTLTYTSSNAQGYTASDWRIVVVIPASVASDPVVSTNDFSGVYLRVATGVTSTWTKIGTGVYTVENPGGATAGVGNIAIAVNFSGNIVSIPSQYDPNFGATISTSSETYNAAASPITYSWVFNDAPTYGSSLRTFTKQ